MGTNSISVSVIVILLVMCIFLYSFFNYKYSRIPTIYDRKKFWIKELLILFNDIKGGSALGRMVIELTPFVSKKIEFKQVKELTEEFLKGYENTTTEFICNHIRLILFKGEEKLTEKDYAQIYAIVLLLYMENKHK